MAYKLGQNKAQQPLLTYKRGDGTELIIWRSALWFVIVISVVAAACTGAIHVSTIVFWLRQLLQWP